MFSSTDLEDFMNKLNVIWKKNIFDDYNDLKLLFEYDLYASLFHYLSPYIEKRPNWRLLVNFGNCDLLLVKFKDQKVIEEIKEKYRRVLRNIHYSELIEEYLVYFEIKTGNYKIDELIKDLKKLKESFEDLEGWKGGPNIVILTIIDSVKKFKDLEDNPEYQDLKNQIEDTKYFELRGFVDPKIPNDLWGIYKKSGERWVLK